MTDFIGIIGGSGLYDIGLEKRREVEVDTPFGAPSDKIILGELSGINFAFLPRHGKGHRIMPSEINYRANIYALKKLGVKRVISVSAVGSMREKLAPGYLILPDQFIDFTKKRESTFFGSGLVGHVSMAEPTCKSLRELIFDIAKELGYQIKHGGTYLCIEGPQFSSKAESFLWRSFNVDIIGMTNMPEAKLAKEAELCYVTLALSTDYDCWHEVEEAVSVDAIIKTLLGNVEKAKNILRNLPSKLGEIKSCNCQDALKYAIITDKSVIPDDTKNRLKEIMGRYLE